MFELRNPTGFPDAGDLRLAKACVLSLLFHAAILGGGSLTGLRPGRSQPPPTPLQATLLPPPLPAPVLLAPAAPQAAVRADPKPKPLPPSRPPHSGFTAVDAARMALRQIAEQPFYPEEAIARGLEGEVLVRLFLDESGNAITARLERSSGHDILDEAAVRAARSVHSLPAGTPGEVLLPVRFRLR
ncbi:MAG: energy transducer TonB [Rhodocyclaceae bacterium]|nr:energy transducer TonB [Rhodocyclaceae bacterium]